MTLDRALADLAAAAEVAWPGVATNGIVSVNTLDGDNFQAVIMTPSGEVDATMADREAAVDALTMTIKGDAVALKRLARTNELTAEKVRLDTESAAIQVELDAIAAR